MNEPLPINVSDDYATLKSAVVFEGALNPKGLGIPLLYNVERRPEGMDDVLRKQGVHLHVLHNLCAPSQIWARDPLIVIDRAVFTAQQINNRREEQATVEDFCNDHGLAYRQWATHGGDVLLPDQQRVLVGAAHMPEEQVTALEREISAITRREACVILHAGVHLDTCMAVLPDGSIYLHPEKIAAESLRKIREVLKPARMVEIPSSNNNNSPVLNLLWLDTKTVLAPSGGVGDRLRAEGYTVIEMGGGEQYDGNIRCTVAPLQRGEG